MRGLGYDGRLRLTLSLYLNQSINLRLSSEQSEGYLRSTHPILPPDIPLQAIYPTPREERKHFHNRIRTRLAPDRRLYPLVVKHSIERSPDQDQEAGHPGVLRPGLNP